MKVQYSLAIAGVVFTFSEISCSETRMFYVRNTRMSDAIKDKGAIFKRIINYLNFSWNVIKERFSKSESPFILTESILECYIEWERLRDLSNLAGVIRHKECRDVHYQTKGERGSSLSKKKSPGQLLSWNNCIKLHHLLRDHTASRDYHPFALYKTYFRTRNSLFVHQILRFHFSNRTPNT